MNDDFIQKLSDEAKKTFDQIPSMNGQSLAQVSLLQRHGHICYDVDNNFAYKQCKYR